MQKSTWDTSLRHPWKTQSASGGAGEARGPLWLSNSRSFPEFGWQGLWGGGCLSTCILQMLLRAKREGQMAIISVTWQCYFESARDTCKSQLSWGDFETPHRLFGPLSLHSPSEGSQGGRSSLGSCRTTDPRRARGGGFLRQRKPRQEKGFLLVIALPPSGGRGRPCTRPTRAPRAAATGVPRRLEATSPSLLPL